jgi:hypothetical protein
MRKYRLNSRQESSTFTELDVCMLRASWKREQQGSQGVNCRFWRDGKPCIIGNPIPSKFSIPILTSPAIVFKAFRKALPTIKSLYYSKIQKRWSTSTKRFSKDFSRLTAVSLRRRISRYLSQESKSTIRILEGSRRRKKSPAWPGGDKTALVAFTSTPPQARFCLKSCYERGTLSIQCMQLTARSLFNYLSTSPVSCARAMG